MKPAAKNKFIEHYSVSMVLLRLTEHYLRYCAAMLKEEPKLRPLRLNMERKAAQQRATYSDLVLHLRAEVYRDMQADLNSEELQAFGAIAHELLCIKNLLELENDLIAFIRSRGVAGSADIQHVATF